MPLQNIFINKKGVSLDEWLKDPENIAKILGKRILYLIKSNLDNNILKFGIVTNYGQEGNGAYRRLISYIHSYGRESDNKTRDQQKNNKHGVQLYGIWGNNYNKDVEPKNTGVMKKETYIKSHLKVNIKNVNRGSERTSITLNELIKLIENDKYSEDIITDVRRSKRLIKV